MDARTEIIKKIKKDGPVSFRDFMDMALYMPLYGYYTSEKRRIGKRGDFFTSSYISPAVGAMVARQLEEMCTHINGLFHIVEFGAGTGLLCADIMDYLKGRPCFENIRYVIVEKSPTVKPDCKNYLRGRISWIKDLAELGEFEGCVLSNELFDNLPVHILEMENQPLEIFVDHRKDFVELKQYANPDLVTRMEYVHLPVSRGNRIEIATDIEVWYQQVSRFLKKGYIISIDYGDHGPGWLNQAGKEGTLRCYYHHELHFNPYIHIGEQDITCDVNFSALSYWGTCYGLEISGFTCQRNFLKGLGFLSYLSDMQDTNENKLFAYDMLIHRMGSRIKVLIQRNHLPYTSLQGFNFAHPIENEMLQTTDICDHRL
jgi:SAM-dependent MidA family methyltransferase